MWTSRVGIDLLARFLAVAGSACRRVDRARLFGKVAVAYRAGGDERWIAGTRGNRGLASGNVASSSFSRPTNLFRSKVFFQGDYVGRRARVVRRFRLFDNLLYRAILVD